ncbi:MAG: hypothetical protein U0R49_03695 [Fimbriimonadales bacterium]
MKLQKRVLEGVGTVLSAETLAHRDGPDEALEPLHELLPGPLIAISGALEESG